MEMKMKILVGTALVLWQVVLFLGGMVAQKIAMENREE
jgi:hypothetical protein